MNNEKLNALTEEQLAKVVGGETAEETKTRIFTCPFCGGTKTTAGIGGNSAHFGKVGWIKCNGCNSTYEVILETGEQTGRGYSYTDSKWIFTPWCTYPVEGTKN